MDEHAYREAVDSAAIFSETDLSGTITYVNPKFCEISGYAPSELLGQNHRILKSGVQDPEFFQRMWSTIGAGQVWKGVICNRMKCGGLYWVDSTIVPLIDRVTGLPQKYVSIRFDLTAERHRIDQALSRREAEHQAYQQAQKSALSKLSAGVAHEVNNPIGFVACNLNALDGYLCALLTFATRCEQQLAQNGQIQALATMRQLLDEIDWAFIAEDAPALMRQTREGVARVQKIAKDLRDFARPDHGGLWESVDVRQFLNVTLALLRHDIQEKADIVRLDSPVPTIEGQPAELNQVFMSLLVNAAQSITAARGTITLSTGVEQDGVWIDVQDTGCGVPAEHLNRIFEPFFTTKEVGGGAGLGLSSAQGIVQRHGGTLTVRNNPEGGAIFRVWLPIHPPQAPAQRA